MVGISLMNHICRKVDKRRRRKVLEWTPRTGRRSIGRWPARRTSDLKLNAGSGSIAEERDMRRNIGYLGLCPAVE